MIDALNGFPAAYSHFAQDNSALSDITEFINILVDLGIMENQIQKQKKFRWRIY